MLRRRARVTRFVILFPGRVGSTYLLSALDSHPAVEAKGERLDSLRPEGAIAQLEWARRFWRGPAVNRHAALGFKTKLRDVLDQDSFRSLLHEFDARVLFLDRRNDVKHAISRITARQLKDKTGQWNRYSPAQRIDPVTVDPDDFDERLHAVESEKATIADYVGCLALPMLHVSYEDLLVDPAATFRSVFAFLRVPELEVRGATLKNTSDNLRDVVVNFDELRARYAGSRYEPMFDEILVR